MVAYNFKAGFVQKIQNRTKQTTIRAARKGGRHVRVGEPMQLYTGMRTSNCIKILVPDPPCVEILPIRLEVSSRLHHTRIMLDGKHMYGTNGSWLARLDGFNTTGELFDFFLREYLLDAEDSFDGFWIRWNPRSKTKKTSEVPK